MKIILVIAMVLYLIFNLRVAKLMSAKEMKCEYINDQCVVGRIFANTFYAPAWLLKGLKVVVSTMIK